METFNSFLSKPKLFQHSVCFSWKHLSRKEILLKQRGFNCYNEKVLSTEERLSNIIAITQAAETQVEITMS